MLVQALLSQGLLCYWEWVHVDVYIYVILKKKNEDSFEEKKRYASVHVRA